MISFLTMGYLDGLVDNLSFDKSEFVEVNYLDYKR